MFDEPRTTSILWSSAGKRNSDSSIQQSAFSSQHSANSLNNGWVLITRCDPLCASVVEDFGLLILIC